jgi:hypothetical protein
MASSSGWSKDGGWGKDGGWDKDSGWSKTSGWSQERGWDKDSGWSKTSGWSKKSGWSKDSDNPQGPTAPVSAGEGKDGDDPQGPTAPVSAGEGKDWPFDVEEESMRGTLSKGGKLIEATDETCAAIKGRFPPQLREALLRPPGGGFVDEDSALHQVAVSLFNAMTFSQLPEIIRYIATMTLKDFKATSHYGAVPSRPQTMVDVPIGHFEDPPSSRRSPPASQYRDLGNLFYSWVMVLLLRTGDKLKVLNSADIKLFAYQTNEQALQERYADFFEAIIGDTMRSHLVERGQDTKYWQVVTWDVSLSTSRDGTVAARAGHIARILMVAAMCEDYVKRAEMTSNSFREQADDVWKEVEPIIEKLQRWHQEAKFPRGGRVRSYEAAQRMASRDQKRHEAWAQRKGKGKGKNKHKDGSLSKDGDDPQGPTAPASAGEGKASGWSKDGDDPQGPTAPASAGEGNYSEADRQDPPTTFQQRKQAAQKRLLSPLPTRDDDVPEDPGNVPDWDPAWDADL